jgi:hypothetical protein
VAQAGIDCCRPHLDLWPIQTILIAIARIVLGGQLFAPV